MTTGPGRAGLALPALGIALYVAIFAVFSFADPDLPEPTIFKDLTSYFYPAAVFLRASLLDGELPLWNPYQLAGTPFLALQAPGAAYPPLLLVLALLPAAPALVVHTLLHLLIAGIFTALFARRLGVGPLGCLVASVVFIGPNASGVHVTSYLSTHSWVPALFWAAERLLEKRSLASASLLAIAMALCFLGGHTQAFLYGVQAMGLFALLRIALRLHGRGDRIRSLGLLAGAGGLALGLVAVQLLPTLEHLEDAARGLDGLGFASASILSHPVPLGQTLTGRMVQPLGTPMLLVPLAIAALLWSRLRIEALFFVALLLFALDFAQGGYGLAFPAYYHLPFGDVFRIPNRIGFLVHFAAALLMGMGLEALLAQLRPETRLRSAFALALLALVAWDVYLRAQTGLRFAPLAAPEYLGGPPGLAAFGRQAGHDRVFLEGTLELPRKMGTMHGFRTVPDYDPLLPRRYMDFFGIPRDEIWHGSVSVLEPTNGTPAQEVELFDLMSVRYYYGPPLLHGKPPDAFGSNEPPMLVRGQALPRAYVVHDLLRVRSESEAIALVRGLAFDRGRQAVVHTEVGPLEPRPKGAREEARIRAESRNRVEVEASCASTCLLVLTDLFHPGWQATLDGEPAEIVPANFLFRGVRLPAGSHRVEFRYRPPAFRRGAAISLASLALAVGALALPRLGARWRGGRDSNPQLPA